MCAFKNEAHIRASVLAERQLLFVARSPAAVLRLLAWSCWLILAQASLADELNTTLVTLAGFVI